MSKLPISNGTGGSGRVLISSPTSNAAAVRGGYSVGYGGTGAGGQHWTSEGKWETPPSMILRAVIDNKTLSEEAKKTLIVLRKLNP